VNLVCLATDVHAPITLVDWTGPRPARGAVTIEHFGTFVDELPELVFWQFGFLNGMKHTISL
jgi:hypothetical protein